MSVILDTMPLLLLLLLLLSLRCDRILSISGPFLLIIGLEWVEAIFGRMTSWLFSNALVLFPAQEILVIVVEEQGHKQLLLINEPHQILAVDNIGFLVGFDVIVELVQVGLDCVQFLCEPVDFLQVRLAQVVVATTRLQVLLF